MSEENEYAFLANEPISDIGRKINKCMNATASGPLIIASDVMSLSDNWEHYKADAGGLTFSQWVSKTCGGGRNIGWWERRHRAVTRLGKGAMRRFSHDVAVYVSENVSDEYLVTVKDAMFRGWKSNGSVPFTMKQAVPIVRKIIGAVVKQRKCKHCERLEGILMKHGIDPNKW